MDTFPCGRYGALESRVLLFLKMVSYFSYPPETGSSSSGGVSFCGIVKPIGCFLTWSFLGSDQDKRLI